MTQHQKWEENEIMEASKCAEHEAIAKEEARREVLEGMMKELEEPYGIEDRFIIKMDGQMKCFVKAYAKSLGIGLGDNKPIDYPVDK